jgi:hypothetical protein
VNHRFTCLFPAFLIAATLAGQTPAILTPAPASLSFTWVTGAALPAAQTISVKAGSSAAAYGISIAPMGAEWITITPASGTLPGAVSVLVNPSGLPIGSYTADLQLSAMGF